MDISIIDISSPILGRLVAGSIPVIGINLKKGNLKMNNITIKYEKIKDKENAFTFGYVKREWIYVWLC